MLLVPLPRLILVRERFTPIPSLDVRATIKIAG